MGQDLHVRAVMPFISAAMHMRPCRHVNVWPLFNHCMHMSSTVRQGGHGIASQPAWPEAAVLIFCMGPRLAEQSSSCATPPRALGGAGEGEGAGRQATNGGDKVSGRLP